MNVKKPTLWTITFKGGPLDGAVKTMEFTGAGYCQTFRDKHGNYCVHDYHYDNPDEKKRTLDAIYQGVKT